MAHSPIRPLHTLDVFQARDANEKDGEEEQYLGKHIYINSLLRTHRSRELEQMCFKEQFILRRNTLCH